METEQFSCILNMGGSFNDKALGGFWLSKVSVFYLCSHFSHGLFSSRSEKGASYEKVNSNHWNDFAGRRSR